MKLTSSEASRPEPSASNKEQMMDDQESHDTGRGHTGEASESEHIHLEQLGRQRPASFKSLTAEIGFVVSICMSQVVNEYSISGFNVLVPKVVEALNIPASKAVWPASALSLVIGSTLPVFGRLTDMYDGRIVYLLGLFWSFIWSLVAGFSQNEVMLNLCRALQGLGSAAFLTASVMLLGITYRPGPRKNLVFSIYGSCVPIGFFAGIFFAGLTAETGQWRWYFWVGAILMFITLISGLATITQSTESKATDRPKMDILGAVLIVSGLVLFTYALTGVSHASGGWHSPQILATLVIGLLCLAAATYVEGWLSSEPLLPPDVFAVPGMLATIVALLLSYGAEGIFLFYGTLYMVREMQASSLQVVAWFAPFAVGGIILSITGGLIMHAVPNYLLLLFGGSCWIVTPLLFALAPPQAHYWAYIFPAMTCATLAMDVIFNVTNVFITTSLPQRRQGLGGGIINMTLHLGISIFLGLADILQSSRIRVSDQYTSYKDVFWFQVACAAVSLLIFAIFVRIKPAASDLTADEKEELQRRESM